MPTRLASDNTSIVPLGATQLGVPCRANCFAISNSSFDTASRTLPIGCGALGRRRAKGGTSGVE